MNNKTPINLDKHFELQLVTIREIEVEIEGLIRDLNGDLRYNFTTTAVLDIAIQLVDLNDARDVLKREIRNAKNLLTSLGLM